MLADRRSVRWVVCAWLVTMINGVPIAALASPCTWTTHVTPDVGSGNNSLLGVSAVNASDALADGAYALTSGLPHALVLAYGGSPAVWKNVPVTTPGTESAFDGQSPFSSSGAYLAGAYRDSAGATLNLGGKLVGSTFTLLKPTNLGATQNDLTAVLSLSSTKAIFVGYYIDSLGFYQNYAALYNAGTFTNLNPPGQGGRYAGTNSEFTGISPVPGTTDIDVSGYRACPVDTLCPFVYVYHQSSGTWMLTTGNTPSVYGSIFNGLVAVSASEVWAAGAWQNSSMTTFGLIEKFNDSTFGYSTETLPMLPSNPAFLGVAAESMMNALAVGGTGTKSTARPLATYWNGATWALASPSASGESAFSAVANVPHSTTYFIVGAKTVSGVAKNLSMTAVCN